MRNLILTCILIAAIPLQALADGIPVTDGKVDVPHTILNLTPSQVEEVAILGTLTLTPDQWKDLREIGPNCPKRYNTIITLGYSDCTCGIAEYTILMAPDKAAILHGQLKGDLVKKLEPLFTQSKTSSLGFSRWDEYHEHDLTLTLDQQDRFYMDAVLIPYPDLLELISKPQMSLYDDPPRRIVKNERTLVFTSRSPLTDKCKTKLQELIARAESTGWKTEVNINGMPTDLKETVSTK